jgi:urate oxidase
VGLGANRYGKSEIRLVKLERGADRHSLRDLTVDVMLDGEFEAVHTTGDNAGLVATDTMRNVVYALAAERPLDSLPAFGAALARHFLGHERVSGATVRIREHPWQRLPGPGDGHPHGFQRGAGGTRVHEVAGGGPNGLRHAAGVEDLLLLRSAGSAFAGFDRDRFTTLPETEDRILATAVKARWEHGDTEPDESGWARVRDRLLEAFVDHPSPSVQFTLNRMGEAVLEAHPDIDRIHLSLPNRHHLPFDVSRFGVDDRGEMFHATTEPFGLIEATVERS